jgi:hypothetical protein
LMFWPELPTPARHGRAGGEGEGGGKCGKSEQQPAAHSSPLMKMPELYRPVMKKPTLPSEPFLKSARVGVNGLGERRHADGAQQGRPRQSGTRRCRCCSCQRTCRPSWLLRHCCCRCCWGLHRVKAVHAGLG